ncbi:chemotaxis protein [Anaerotignum sp. MB30-C6]|uniref:chemotaxis protein n=1 Tax=Anaerotignum sp. MB30-C6 TaxID=3070814 RepID=UPI0027DE1029|nr:chemotaxis protein [Anaerotignum sp. MB30-C6]WMI80963.1 chemotaxis protein [Anaerotignum sp. MB30-C6]
MGEKNRTGILLESGTNEIEIMEFKVNGKLYGINVAKVREIMVSESVTPMPLAHPVVEGVFKPRGTVITVFNLARYLFGEDASQGGRDLFIVTNFNKMHIAFRVDSVEGIVRLSWADIQKPDNTVSGGEEGVATGITEINGNLVVILDFEKIVAEIAPRTGIQADDINKLGHREPNNTPIILAEDSVLLSKMILDCLKQAGFTNITKFDNGQEAWDFLKATVEENSVKEKVSLVITDIEMPAMDGHRLTKLIKGEKSLKQIPVVIFSSLINEELYIKGKQLGADEQISKPEIGNLVEVIDHLLERRKTK